MKKITAMLLSALLVVSLAGCKDAQPEITLTDPEETGFSGVTIRIVDVHRTDRDRIVQVQWSNETDYDVLYGEPFWIQRLENGAWVSCEAFPNTAFTTQAYMLKPHTKAEKRYSLAWIYDVSAPGTYRFKTNCTVYDTPEGTDCNLWAEFTVGDGVNIQPDGEGGNAPEARTEPPELTVTIGTEEIRARKGGYSWSYALGKGEWSGVEADSLHPLQCGSDLKNHETSMETAKLVFETAPDSCTVRCWPDSMLSDGDVGDSDSRSQAVTLQGDTVTLLPSTTGGYVYEVRATWKDNGSFHGSCTYVFYATSYPVDPLTD